MLANRHGQPVDELQGAVFHDVQPLPELAELREAVYVGGKKVLSEDYLKQLTPLSLAIWYMDDGCSRPIQGCAGSDRGWQRTDRDLRRSDDAGHKSGPCSPRRYVGHRGDALR